jgi:hypothetical protein
MELQRFISSTPDYLKELKENKVYVRKYTKLGLAIIKCYHNNEYDYDKQPWLKYCRGAVININTHKLVCFPPLKATVTEDLNGIIDEIDVDAEYQPLVEGTMMNMFHHNDEWMISTRSNIGGKNSWDGKIPFSKMFTEIIGDKWFDQLSKDNCYSFVLRHQKNRIVSPIPVNAIYLIECHKINDTIESQELPEISGIYNIINFNHDEVTNYKDDLYFSIKGFTIKTKNNRVNWLNPNYLYVKNLKMNYNDKFLNYIELRQTRLLSEYLNYFPEDQYTFKEYRDQFNSIKQKLHESYILHFVRREKELKEIDYPLRPLLFKLHEYYKETGEIITIKVVSDYLHGIPSRKMLFIKNYLF